MSFKGLLNTTCTIQSKTVSYNASSREQEETWADSVTSVKCRLDQATGTEKRTPIAIFSRVTHVLFMGFRTLSSNTHRIVIDSITYNILLVSNASGEGHHIEAFLEVII